MKVVIAWVALLCAAALVAGTATSCSISHRSDQYACTVQADCDGGRLCVDGLCTFPPGLDASLDAREPITDGAHPDAHTDAGQPVDAPPMDVCPQGCTSCDFGPNKVCHIDCSAPGAACGAQPKCPPTWSCDIACNTQGSCRNGITCAASQDCNIACTAPGSCRNIACGTGTCNIQCDGFNTCRGIACGDSCACDVTCGGNQSCVDNIFCTGPQCGTFDGGCNSTFATCNTCP